MKRTISDNLYNSILNILNRCGINSDVIAMAKKMDNDLPKLFHDKIFCVENEKELQTNKDVIVKMLLGIYGNYLATLYYKNLGYKVENEYPVYDENDMLLTKADLAFVDEDGNKNLCEVKLASQIIDNIRNYKSEDEELYNGRVYFDMDDDIIKYKKIGDKLITQVKKLKKSGQNITVVIFEGCYMDDIVRDKLTKELGVNIKTIAINVKILKEQIEEIVEEISNDLLEKNNIYLSSNNYIEFIPFKVA